MVFSEFSENFSPFTRKIFSKKSSFSHFRRIFPRIRRKRLVIFRKMLYNIIVYPISGMQIISNKYKGGDLESCSKKKGK